MDHSHSRNIIQILRSTFRHLEEDVDFSQDDPAVVQLKRHILQSLAEFDSQKTYHSGSELRSDIEEEVEKVV